MTPSPASTAPAFSPGPRTTCGPSMGRRRSERFECLYEQCSLHISENIASSTSVGSRPSFPTISPNSKSVRPSSRARAARAPAFALGRGINHFVGADGLENLESVGRTRTLVHGVLGMWHEANDVAV